MLWTYGHASKDILYAELDGDLKLPTRPLFIWSFTQQDICGGSSVWSKPLVQALFLSLNLHLHLAEPQPGCAAPGAGSGLSGAAAAG